MLTKSFKRGFVRGFSAPFLFFSPLPVRRPKEFNGSVEKAWRDVGRALSEATAKQGAIIEQKTRTETAIKRRHTETA